jgi:predicted thioesterase
LIEGENMGEDIKLQAGIKGYSSGIVTEQNTALAMRSGEIEVYATPAMIALMEEAAVKCLKEYLPADKTSVGVKMNVAHISATPLNNQVRAEATLVLVDARRLSFELVASDETGKIGEGTHERVLVDREKFMSKTLEKTRM